MSETETRTTIALTGVPETMLWPLWNRGVEARRPDRLIEDPMSAALLDRIDYDFAAHFGKPSVFHAIRARVCDDLILAHLQRARAESRPPTVVSLGDGLETQFWRVDDGRVHWISVDVPEAIAVRRRLLPAHPRAALVDASALDPGWMDAVPEGATPFISAAGLLMYFHEADVMTLLTRIAARFPGADVFFDTISPYFSRKSLRGLKVGRAYTAPPMPWGVRLGDLDRVFSRIPGMIPVTVQTYVDPFPSRSWPFTILNKIGFLRRTIAPGLVHARVTSAATTS